MPQWTALKQARTASKKTLAQLAEAAGGHVSAAAISHWEMNGMTPSFQAIRGICLATGVTPNELFGVGDRSYAYDDPVPSFTEEELEMMRGAVAALKEEAKQRVMEETISSPRRSPAAASPAG